MSRPKRSKRAVLNYDEDRLESVPGTSKKVELLTNKRKATGEGRQGSLEWMLSSAKSPLCTTELSKLINEDTWVCLSPQDREELSALLPPTVHPFFEPSLPAYHPSNLKVDSVVDPMFDERPPAIQLDGIEASVSAFINCPFLDSAMTTFQDHLYSGWYARKHLEDVRRYKEGVKNGSLHAPWKDEVWGERSTEEHESLIRSQARQDLGPIVSHGLMASRDILVYRRKFPELGIVVEKDVLIHGSSQYSITVVAPAHTECSLPMSMIMNDSAPPPGLHLQQMEIRVLEELESAILQMDGRVPASYAGIGNSWKRFSLWKWSTALAEQFQLISSFQGGVDTVEVGTRGPREERGTLFYLRGSYLPTK